MRTLFILLCLFSVVQAAKIEQPIDTALQEALKQALIKERNAKRQYQYARYVRRQIQQKIKDRK